MRALSASQAARCEQGKGKRCRCRCGGMFHGAARNVGGTGMPVLQLSDLDVNDPHYVPRREVKVSRPAPLTGEQLTLPGMPDPRPEWEAW